MPLRSKGAELRRRRLLKGMTLTEFAAETGYSLNHASQVELGNYNAGPRYLRAAARLFNCEISDLAEEPTGAGAELIEVSGQSTGAAGAAENGGTG